LLFPDDIDITDELLQKSLYPVKCSSQDSGFSYADFEYDPNYNPDVSCLLCLKEKLRSQTESDQRSRLKKRFSTGEQGLYKASTLNYQDQDLKYAVNSVVHLKMESHK
jgi:hypothetical protein